MKNPIEIEGFHSQMRINFTKEEIHQINKITTLYFKGNNESVFLDVYTWPLFLVSEKVKDIIEAYEHRVIFKSAVLTNIEHKIQKLYYLMIVDKVDCIASSTQYRFDKITKLVIDESKADGRSVFEISDSKDHYLIFKLNLMESILRREAQGLAWEEVESK